MKVLHFADLHLDTPFVGLSDHLEPLREQLMQAPLEAFKRGVSIAINQAVDLVLIAGDIYDANHPSLKAQIEFRNQMERLNKADIPVVILHGNHDYLQDDQYLINYGENVYLFKDQQVSFFDIETKAKETVRVYGFSYLQRWIKETMINQFPKNANQTDFTIGMMHGELAHTSSNYAPFTVQQLLDKKYDYWALGHIHQPQSLNQTPPIIYSGTPQGRHRNEQGDHGAYLVELKKNKPTTTQFVSLAQIIFYPTTIYCQPDWQWGHISDAINQTLENYKANSEADQQSYIIDFTLEQAHWLSDDLKQQLNSTSLQDLFPIQTTPNDQFIAVGKLHLKVNYRDDLFTYSPALKASFDEAVAYIKSSDGYELVMSDLFNHPVVQSYLPNIREDEVFKQEVLNETLNLINQYFDVDVEEVSDAYTKD